MIVWTATLKGWPHDGFEPPFIQTISLSVLIDMPEIVPATLTDQIWVLR